MDKPRSQPRPKRTPRIAISQVVTTVFEQMLRAVHEGELRPGQRLNDAEIAEQFGVSRTPVREALQRLRDIGVVETSPGRFTRVVNVTPAHTLQAYVVWLALYEVLVREVVPTASPATLERLVRDHERYLAAVAALNTKDIARHNFDFFGRMLASSENATLQRAIMSVVHVIRLGSLHLPDYVDFVALGHAHDLLIQAARERDLDPALEAMAALADMGIPQS
ncbi:MAG: GntR family transcriptional regulator [Rhodoglobus sp.]